MTVIIVSIFLALSYSACWLQYYSGVDMHLLLFLSNRWSQNKAEYGTKHCHLRTDIIVKQYAANL